MSDRLGDYELITEIARSASGRIFLAQAPGSQHLLAIKEMILEPESGLPAEEQIARFKRESDIHLQLDHPNIVQAIAGGADGDRHYLVMEYQPGHTWHQIMERERSPIPQVLEWGVQLCRALQHCHEMGIVHRDVKPANLLVSPAGQLKIIDFGMARRAFAPGITQAKMMLGTLNYMSPEQLLDATSVDARSDVFPAGIILYKALTGNMPFPGHSATDIAHKLLYAEPTDPREHNPKLPDSLAQKLLKCLSKDPDFRYLSAESFARDLEEELHNAEIYLAQGLIHHELGEWRDANHCFQQAAAHDNGNARAWFYLGDALAHLDQPQAASECYLKAVTLDSSYVEAYRRLGDCYRAQGNLGQALKMFQRAWVLDPKDRDTCMRLGLAYRDSGQLPEALETFAILVEHHPDCERAHFELGRLHYRGDRQVQARQCFERAYHLRPADPEVLFNLASLCHELGDHAQAEDLYEKLLVMEVEHTHARHNLACLWVAQGRYSEAETLLVAVLESEKWAPSFMLLGQVYERTGRLKEAVDCYRSAQILMPDNPDAYLFLANALQRSFQPNAAIDVLQAAIQYGVPSRAEILYHLALAYRTKGEDELARKTLRACLESKPGSEVGSAAELLLVQLGRKRR